MNKTRMAGLICLLLGAGLATGGWLSFMNIRSWLSTSVATQGEVTALRTKYSYDRKKHRTTRYYHPRVSFRTDDGRQVTFESEIGSAPPAYRIGEWVAVRYQPSHPADARINSFFELWLLPLIFGFTGSIFLLVGVACWRVPALQTA